MTDTSTESIMSDLARPIAMPRRGAKVREAKAWEAENSDHSPNVGCYAVQAAAGMVDLAVELLTAAGRTPTEALVRWAAGHLLWAADEIQAGARTDGRHERMDNSHSRARGVLRTALAIVAFPVDAATSAGLVPPGRADSIHDWHRQAVAAGVRLLRMSVDLSGIDWRDQR